MSRPVRWFAILPALLLLAGCDRGKPDVQGKDARSAGGSPPDLKENRMEKRPWFLGPKGEKSDVLEHFLLEALRDYVGWRRNFHPEDERIIQKKGRRSLEFQESLDLMDERFYQLLDRMKDSFPFFSSRYIAHMTSETLIPANLGYFLGMLYNQNNVTSEASPVTTQLEQEAMMDLVDNDRL